MDLNSIIFPAPASTYTSANLQNLIWIPRTRFFAMKSLLKGATTPRQLSPNFPPESSFTHQKIVQIPCHFQKPEKDCKDTILYFHGNAEDIGYGQTFVKRLSTGLKANVLSVEYPGYGIYEGKTTAEQILEDAEIAYDFLISELGLKSENIILLGRSVGSGPAIHLAANRKVKGLVLISPFTSIKEVAKDLTGSIIGHLVADRFRNIEEIKFVECPTYFIHGKEDKLVPLQHSLTLRTHCKGISQMHTPEKMTHNAFSILGDIVKPVRWFFGEVGIETEYGSIQLPEYVFRSRTEEKKSSPRKNFLGRLWTIS